MSPKREETAARVLSRLRASSWVLPGELAKGLHLSTPTVRGYLYRLIIDGLAERRPDDSIRNPSTGGPGHRYNALHQPIGQAEPTGELLCDRCATKAYGDVWRYGNALTSEPEAPDVEDDEAWRAYEAKMTCNRCGQPILNIRH